MPSPVVFNPVPFMRWLVVAFGLVCAVSQGKCVHLPSFPVLRDKPRQPRHCEWEMERNRGMETIRISGAEIYYDERFLLPEEATRFFDTLLSNCAWERRRTSFGHAVPRDEAYYGDPGTDYTYSRREYKPLRWIPELLSLKARAEKATPELAYANLGITRLSYNAVLCNLYRDGNDSVGLHADAEPEMGPVIASVSLGAERSSGLSGRTAASHLPRNCHTAVCSSWRATHRKTSNMKFQKNRPSRNPVSTSHSGV